MLLFVVVPERSTAMNVCPQSPIPFIPPWIRKPPRLTRVFWSNVGVTPPFCALDERRHLNWPLKSDPPMKRLPLVSTSSAPVSVSFGTLIGLIQVSPPSVERVNSPKSQAKKPVQNWYWNPCPGPPVLSMVNHSLS